MQRRTKTRQMSWSLYHLMGLCCQTFSWKVTALRRWGTMDVVTMSPLTSTFKSRRAPSSLLSRGTLACSRHEQEHSWKGKGAESWLQKESFSKLNTMKEPLPHQKHVVHVHIKAWPLLKWLEITYVEFYLVSSPFRIDVFEVNVFLNQSSADLEKWRISFF